VYAWAKRKRLIAVNPFEDCVVEVPRKAQTRATDKAFNDDEVSIILQAALQVEVRPGEPWDAAKRWVPWLSAYTGARAGELTQLRVKDIDAVPAVRNMNQRSSIGLAIPANPRGEE
jgi:integrase